MPIALRRRSLRAPTVTRSLILGQPLSATMACPTRYRPSMASTETIPGFRDRLALYGIDDRTRSLLAEAWPAIAPGLERAIHEILQAVSGLPRVGGVVAGNRDMVKELEVAHFQALLQGKLDQRYAESCRQTVEQEAALGLDARMRNTAAFPRRGSPRRPGAYRRPSASTSPVP